MSEIARPSAFVLRFFSEPKEEFGAPAPWSFEGSPARHRPSDLVWSGDDNFVRGTWRPPSFMEKLLSGTWGQGDRGDLQAFMATQEESGKRLGGRETILLIQCFNNLDVGVTQCQTEPRGETNW